MDMDRITDALFTFLMILGAFIGAALVLNIIWWGCILPMCWVVKKLTSKMSFIEKRPCLIPSFIVVVLSLIALSDRSQNYYFIYKVVIFGLGFWILAIGYSLKNTWLQYVGFLLSFLGLIALAREFSREIWEIIDVVLAIVFTVIGFSVKELYLYCITSSTNEPQSVKKLKFSHEIEESYGLINVMEGGKRITEGCCFRTKDEAIAFAIRYNDMEISNFESLLESEKDQDWINNYKKQIEEYKEQNLKLKNELC